MEKRKKRILEVKHTKNISYPEAKKFIENSLATTTYANIVRPTNNSAQNQGILPLSYNESNKRIKDLSQSIKRKLDQLDN